MDSEDLTVSRYNFADDKDKKRWCNAGIEVALKTLKEEDAILQFLKKDCEEQKINEFLKELGTDTPSYISRCLGYAHASGMIGQNAVDKWKSALLSLDVPTGVIIDNYVWGKGYGSSLAVIFI